MFDIMTSNQRVAGSSPAGGARESRRRRSAFVLLIYANRREKDTWNGQCVG